jgi:hypothetical protein
LTSPGTHHQTISVIITVSPTYRRLPVPESLRAGGVDVLLRLDGWLIALEKVATV